MFKYEVNVMPIGEYTEKPISIMGITGLYEENVSFIIFTHTDRPLHNSKFLVKLLFFLDVSTTYDMR